ncbi:MAG: transglycosylase SLT domain-containing protein [Pseudobdellovibrio sp.]
MKLSKALFIILACMVTSVSGFSERHIVLPSDSTNFSEYELQKFQEHTNSRLPIYIEQFKKYSNIYQIPWSMLAAVAYQESKWDQGAVSYTGVRGLMQITEQTAEHLGIEDRKDPYENIKGGAYYLKYLFDKTSPNLTSMQRWAHALIAYNIGWGHYRDAYKLALRLNKNPGDWDDLKTILPKLEDENFYVGLNHGYARGNETVEFVENVMNYYKLMNRSVPQVEEKL